MKQRSHSSFNRKEKKKKRKKLFWLFIYICWNSISWLIQLLCPNAISIYILMYISPFCLLLILQKQRALYIIHHSTKYLWIGTVKLMITIAPNRLKTWKCTHELSTNVRCKECSISSDLAEKEKKSAKNKTFKEKKGREKNEDWRQ